MEVALVVLGAIIGAAGSIAGGIIAANYQLRHARQDRLRAREEDAARELLKLMSPVRRGARMAVMEVEGMFNARGQADPAQLSAIGEWYGPAGSALRQAWNDHLDIDTHDRALRAAAEAVITGTMYATFHEDLDIYMPEAQALRYMELVTANLVTVLTSFLHGEALRPDDAPPVPDPSDPIFERHLIMADGGALVPAEA